jgi:predicted MFS family arabinose efflux permease
MNLMHAGFSAGAVIGALGGGVILGSAMGFRAVLIALAIICALLGLAIMFVRFPPADHHPDSAELLSAIRLILRDANLQLLALLAVLGVVGESVGFVWSVIYLRQLGAPALVSGMSFALFNGAMLCGRLINSSIVARRGFRFSMALSSVTLIFATLLLIASHNLWLATAGFILMGLGVAGVVPTVLGRASQLAPNMPGAISGGIMAAAYIGFIACPPAIGWVAQATSLRLALSFVGISGAAMLILVVRISQIDELQSKRQLA